MTIIKRLDKTTPGLVGRRRKTTRPWQVITTYLLARTQSLKNFLVVSPEQQEQDATSAG
jgi:hypothetical protein